MQIPFWDDLFRTGLNRALPTENLRVAIDVGGTFTDLLACHSDSGVLFTLKLASTPTRPERAVIQALETLMSTWNQGKAQTAAGQRKGQNPKIQYLVHSTTLASNMLLGQVGLEIPKVAMVTTKRFRDVIEIGRQRRQSVYDIFVERPKPLVPKENRFEIEERVAFDGKVILPLSPRDVKAVASKIRSRGIRVVAVCFINSYANPKHELVARKQLHNSKIPTVVCSSEVNPEYREYERFSTAVVNAALIPKVSEYLAAISRSLREKGYAKDFYVMQSNGGTIQAARCSSFPVTLIESGPASGVIGSAFLGRELGLDNILSFDMGGTTAKAGAIRNGEPEVVTEFEAGGKSHSGRWVKGSGYPVRFPMLDLAEVSAGGGTLAWADSAGSLRVGPTSAGAYPGPACYGFGGQGPTVTDANLLLGRLNQTHLLGGKMNISIGLAKKALFRLMHKVGLSDLAELASAIVALVNDEMCKALKIVSVERGIDTREFAMIAFGGAGPMHASELAEELQVNKIIVPRYPGLFSAFGCLVADVRREYSSSMITLSSVANETRIERNFLRMEQRALRDLKAQGVKADNIKLIRALDMRYEGESYEILVPVNASSSSAPIDKPVSDFHMRYEARYGFASYGDRVEIVNLRLFAVGSTDKPRIVNKPTRQLDVQNKSRGRRRVYFPDEGFVQCPVHIRDLIFDGSLVKGPAVIEQYDSTTVVYPTWVAIVQSNGSLVMERQ